MRRAPADVRKIDPDPVYKSLLVSQVINKVLWRGKKGAARRIVYGALEIVERRTSGDPIQVLKKGNGQRSPATRGALQARWWIVVSGTGGGAAAAVADPRGALACRGRP